MKISANIEKFDKLLKIVLSFTIIGVIGIIDLMTGNELALSLFYLIPVYLLTWHIERLYGILASIASAIVWLIDELGASTSYSHSLIAIWNTLIVLMFFIIVTLLLSRLKIAMEQEKKLARIDNLTGAVNSRYFFELAQVEIERSQRYEHSLTIVYIDLDNFKFVNDKFGHSNGDRALRTVVNYLTENLRKIDIIARLGGDEFALLLPETEQNSASIVLSKLQKGLLEKMQENNWPITFSIGVLTCNPVPNCTTLDELLKKADDLMYSVKHEKKNAIKYATYSA